MKRWTEEDLILFYYDELGTAERKAIERALEDNDALKKKYAAICLFLDKSLAIEVPRPDPVLNHRIMASIYQHKERESKLESKLESKTSAGKYFFERWLDWLHQSNLIGATLVLSFVVIGIFYLGRLSVERQDIPEFTQEVSDPEIVNPIKLAPVFDHRASRRILLQNVSYHLQTTDRLLTQVSNGNGDLPSHIESRRIAIEEMIALNRLYRRVMEKTDDRLLVNVLAQMEVILLEVNNMGQTAEKEDWENIRERIDSIDLLFKLRASNKKIDNKINSKVI